MTIIGGVVCIKGQRNSLLLMSDPELSEKTCAILLVHVQKKSQKEKENEKERLRASEKLLDSKTRKIKKST